MTTVAGYLLVIPRWHPTPLNRLLKCHWGTAAKRKRSDWEIVAGHFLAERIPPAEGKRRLSVWLSLRPGQRAADPDAYHKTLLDALTACGALVDDNRQGVELPPVEFFRGTAGDWGTMLVLEDVDAPGLPAAKSRKARRQGQPARFVGWQRVGKGSWQAVVVGDTEHHCRKALLRSPCPAASGRDLCVLPAGRVPEAARPADLPD